MKRNAQACEARATIIETIWGHALVEVPHGAWTRTAVHEAGHAAAASLLRRGLQEVALFPSGGQAAGGTWLSESTMTPRPAPRRRGAGPVPTADKRRRSRSSTWYAREVQVALAGLAAEWAVLGSMAECGAGDDLLQSKALATAAIQLSGGRSALGPRRRTAPPPEWLVDLAGDDGLLFEYLHAAFGAAFRLVVTRDGEIATIALDLLDHGVLPGRRVHEVVRAGGVRSGAVEALLGPYAPCLHQAG